MTDETAPGERRRRKPVVIRVLLGVAVLVGGFLVYRPLTMPVLTDRDPVVLSSIVNLTGDAVFDDTLGEALALQLRQSPFLNLVPDQQVQSTLRLMGREPMTPITAEVGRELCQRAGAKALLGGTIALLGSAYAITLTALDCADGTVLIEEQTQAGAKETVLAALGSATSVFREKLGESLESIHRYDTKIEEATTSSLDALKAYAQGLRMRRTNGDFDSVPLFRSAIEIDPEFALAYARLGTVYSNLGQGEEARKMTAKAYDYRHKVSEVERLYIEGRFHTTVEPNVQKALDVYRVWLAVYPHDYTALVNSALLLKQRGEVAEALLNQQAAARAAPDQPMAWASLGDTYLGLGRLDEAKAAFDRALKLQNSAGVRARLFAVGILTGDQALADAQIEALRGQHDEVDLLAIRIQAAAYRGQMEEAAGLAIEWQELMEAGSRRRQTGQGLVNLAISEALVGFTDIAQARVAEALEADVLQSDALDERLVLAAILRDAATAGKLLPQAIEHTRQGHGTAQAAPLSERALHALAMLADGHPLEAISLLEPATFDVAHAAEVSVWTLAQLLNMDWALAIRGLTLMVDDRSHRSFGSMKAFAMVSMARAHAALGQPDAARKSYQVFFEFWKDADPDVPLLRQAREEFRKL